MALRARSYVGRGLYRCGCVSCPGLAFLTLHSNCSHEAGLSLEYAIF